MNIPVPAPPKEARRLSTLLGSQLERAETVSTGTTSCYAEVLTTRIPYHRGVIVHSAVSLVLAEFEEAADAVNCAIDIQERFAQYNKLHLDEGMVEAKIGIHHGEIFLSEGKQVGAGVDTAVALLSEVPANKIYLTREVLVRVLKLLPLKFENLGKKNIGPSQVSKEIFSIAWEAVTGNLEASLKKLGEDDLQKATQLSTKLGFEPSKRASPIVIILLLIFLIVLFKFLKWF